jgi:dUTPase
MQKDVKDFIKNFDIADNALKMRCLIRWNGRDLRERENLSEHTHLVCACAIKLYDFFVGCSPELKEKIDFEYMIRLSMIHDSLELLRGDILSVTKNKIPNLRDEIDSEEKLFEHEIIGKTDELTGRIVHLADLMACYKFIEYELRFPNGDFVINAYEETKNLFDYEYEKFCNEYGIIKVINSKTDLVFAKGYEEDAGIDIFLQEDVTFMPMSTQTFSLKVKVTPKKGEMSILCSRSSAASKGLIVANCPIDPNYEGEITAIVHNVSNNIVKYKKGESFCQIVTVQFCAQDLDNVKIKNTGKRTCGKLGSTGDVQ